MVAEFVGSALLVAIVVGSGIAAERLSPTDVGLQLLENSLATAFGLGVLILVFGPVSGAHFNPVVSMVDWLLGRQSRTGMNARLLWRYAAVQISGAIGGAVLANVMFDHRAVEIATKDRLSAGHLLAEVVATAGLVVVIFTLARTGRAGLSAAAVGAYDRPQSAPGNSRSMRGCIHETPFDDRQLGWSGAWCQQTATGRRMALRNRRGAMMLQPARAIPIGKAATALRFRGTP